MMCSRVLCPQTSKLEDWWIERVTPGPCLMSTARGKLSANVLPQTDELLQPFRRLDEAGYVVLSRVRSQVYVIALVLKRS